jgi:hypothetical protein
VLQADRFVHRACSVDRTHVQVGGFWIFVLSPTVQSVNTHHNIHFLDSSSKLLGRCACASQSKGVRREASGADISNLDWRADFSVRLPIAVTKRSALRACGGKRHGRPRDRVASGAAAASAKAAGSVAQDRSHSFLEAIPARRWLRASSSRRCSKSDIVGARQRPY